VADADDECPNEPGAAENDGCPTDPPPPSPPSGECVADTGVPVYPGAEGYGIDTPAGRCGTIIHVTNLNASGPGSLAAAASASGPRIIVFDVSGNIDLGGGMITIDQPFAAIAGETAPSPGITIKGRLNVRASDVLVRHIRVRAGDQNVSNPGSYDAVRISGERPGVDRVILDHVSVSWGIDGTLDITGGNNDITVSNSIIAETLHCSLHPKGCHSRAMLVKYGRQERIAFLKNLIIHHAQRYPQIGESDVVLINNFGFSAPSKIGAMPAVTGPERSDLSLIGNRYLTLMVGDDAAGDFYVADNGFDEPARIPPGAAETAQFVSSPPFPLPSVSIWPASQLESRLAASVGARPADRDAVDERLVQDMLNRTGGLIDSDEVGGWPALTQNVRVFDVGPDPHGDDDGDGYTNLEELLHQLAAELEG
jgi:pectate lyase